MGRRLVSGAVAGLAGGIVFATLATLMADVVTGIGTVTLIGLIKHAVGAGTLLSAWLIVLGVGILLGVLFGVLVGRPGRDGGTVAACGLLCGLALSLLVGLVAVPLMLGLTPADRATWAWLPATLMSCLLFTSVLAIIVVWLQEPAVGGDARHTFRRGS